MAPLCVIARICSFCQFLTGFMGELYINWIRLKNPTDCCIINHVTQTFMAKQNSVLIRNEDDEYAQVRRDLIFVVILNLVFLAALLGLYFFNRATGNVDTFFSHLLKF